MSKIYYSLVMKYKPTGQLCEYGGQPKDKHSIVLAVLGEDLKQTGEMLIGKIKDVEICNPLPYE